MFQDRNRETINSTWKVAVSFKIIMSTSVTRSSLTTQHQTCKTKTKTAMYKTKSKTYFLVSDRSCPKTDGLRPHHCPRCGSMVPNLARLNIAKQFWPKNSVKRFLLDLLFILLGPVVKLLRQRCGVPNFEEKKLKSKNEITIVGEYKYERQRVYEHRHIILLP